jgi:hypothetical protein
MRLVWMLLFAISAAHAQTGTASIQGAIRDAGSQTPVPAAWVTAVRAGAPPFSKSTKSGGDGAFVIDGLAPGAYSICVQTAGGPYLNPCEWDDAKPVTVGPAQAVSGVVVGVRPAAVVTVGVGDPQRLLAQTDREGRRPELSVGVWLPNGLYRPARAPAGPVAPGTALGAPGIPTYTYRLAVPPGTPLRLHIGSRNLRLGDAGGAPLPGNARSEAFQHAAGDAGPRNFSFTVLGLLP